MNQLRNEDASHDSQLPPRWPADQKLEVFMRDPTVVITDFADHEAYHPRLIEGILRMEQDSRITHRPSEGGSKVLHVHRWGFPEADLIHARALELFRQITGKQNPEVDLCWANISRAGDYLGPHSHTRCIGSVVYSVDPGKEEASRPKQGRLHFADPRFKSFCPDEDGCMTRAHSPNMNAGTMIMFPSQLVHHVDPYFGATPRITLSWNIR